MKTTGDVYIAGPNIDHRLRIRTSGLSSGSIILPLYTAPNETRLGVLLNSMGFFENPAR